MFRNVNGYGWFKKGLLLKKALGGVNKTLIKRLSCSGEFRFHFVPVRTTLYFF